MNQLLLCRHHLESFHPAVPMEIQVWDRGFGKRGSGMLALHRTPPNNQPLALFIEVWFGQHETLTFLRVVVSLGAKHLSPRLNHSTHKQNLPVWTHFRGAAAAPVPRHESAGTATTFEQSMNFHTIGPTSHQKTASNLRHFPTYCDP